MLQMLFRSFSLTLIVLPGLVPGHGNRQVMCLGSWMAGPSPAKTIL
jgi:hypothetical protein